MEVFNLLKFWRNRTPQVNKDSFDMSVSVTCPQCDFDEFSMKNKSSIVISRSVGITSIDNDTNKQFVHKKLSNIDGEANANAFNANVFSLEKKLHTNLKSQSPVLILGSSPKLRVFMPGLKNSSKTEFNCMATPKREKSEDSSSNKYLKLIKPLYVKASKIRIFDQSVAANSRTDGEKQRGSTRPAVFREVCKSLMKSKSSVRTVPVPVPVPVSRRDDSVLQQEDGIQSAILHCKRSYSSSSSLFSTISQECTVLSRSASESCNQKATINPQIIASTEGEMK